MSDEGGGVVIPGAADAHVVGSDDEAGLAVLANFTIAAGAKTVGTVVGAVRKEPSGTTDGELLTWPLPKILVVTLTRSW